MKIYKFNILVVAVCASLFLVACGDDDDNGNVIDLVTCEDGVKNGDEEGIDCGGTECEPCAVAVDFSGNWVQEDVMGRPGINTVFGATNEIKNSYNVTATSDRASFQQGFQDQLELYHDVYGDALGVDIDYETNILGLDAATFTTVLANFDALQVSPTGQTVYYDGDTGVALTGRGIPDDVIDVSLTLMFGGMNGDRFDGNNGTPQLTSDGVDFGDRIVGAFPYLEAPNQ